MFRHINAPNREGIVLHPYSFVIRMFQRFGGNPFLPYMHIVSDRQLPHVRHLFSYKGVREFKRDIDTLLRYYTPVALSDLVGAIHSKTTLPPRAMHLSFDDGYAECATVIAPILRAKGVPATFFLCPTFLGNKSVFYRNTASIIVEQILSGVRENALREAARILHCKPEMFSVIDAVLHIGYQQRAVLPAIADIVGIDCEAYLQEWQPYLMPEEVYALITDGFTIGSHGMEHEDFSTLVVTEQQATVIHSVEEIAKTYRTGLRAFSFPFGDTPMDQDFFDSIHGAVDVAFGVANMKRDSVPFMLHRSNIESPAVPLEKTLESLYLRYLFRRITRKGTIQRIARSNIRQQIDTQPALP